MNFYLDALGSAGSDPIRYILREERVSTSKVEMHGTSSLLRSSVAALITEF